MTPEQKARFKKHLQGLEETLPHPESPATAMSRADGRELKKDIISGLMVAVVDAIKVQFAPMAEKQEALLKASTQSDLFSLRISQLNRKLDEQAHQIEVLKTAIAELELGKQHS